MVNEIILDRPRVVTQDPRTCWAAAFESWADADAAMNGTTNSRDMSQLISDFDRWGMTRNGRLTLGGMRLLASLGMMRMREHHPGRLTPTKFSEMLTEYGYLYLAVYGHLINNVRRGHALVCYGVDDSRIYVMDPWPGHGYRQIPSSHFVQSTGTRVFIGTSLTTALSRSIEQSFSILLQG